MAKGYILVDVPENAKCVGFIIHQKICTLENMRADVK